MNHRTQNPKELAEIPIHVVAGIAAQLTATEPNPVERVRQAYTLLDIAEAGRYGLEKQKCFHAGVAAFCAEAEAEKFWEKRQDDPLCVYNEEGDKAPVDFETGLSKMFARLEKKDREPRLALFIQTKWLDAGKRIFDAMDKSQKANLKQSGFVIGEAADIISDYKNHGIPFETFCEIRDALPGWWKDHFSRSQSDKRKGKTKDKTKGNQGRVVRKNDKRKGSKAGSFLKTLKKNP